MELELFLERILEVIKNDRNDFFTMPLTSPSLHKYINPLPK